MWSWCDGAGRHIICKEKKKVSFKNRPSLTDVFEDQVWRLSAVPYQRFCRLASKAEILKSAFLLRKTKTFFFFKKYKPGNDQSGFKTVKRDTNLCLCFTNMYFS